MKRMQRGGFGIVISTLFMLLAVMGTLVATAGRRGGLAAHTQAIAEGRRALEIGRSCLAEALVDFKEQANRPGTTWHDALRGSRTTAAGMNSWLVGELVPRTTIQAIGGESITIAPVRVSVWRDQAVDPEAGPHDEKFALLTLTADVSVTPGGWNPFRGVVRRQVQRSYHLKQTRVSAPDPFSRWTLYVHELPLLETQRADYDRTIRDVAKRRREIERAYGGEIDAIISAIEGYLRWMVQKVKDWDDIRADIAKLRREREKMKLEDLFARVLEKLHLPSLLRKKIEKLVREVISGTIKPMVDPLGEKLERVIEALERELAEDIRKALSAFNLPDEETFRRVAANPYPPANLRADIAFQLEAGTWPTYRGYAATPEGLATGGDDLTKPVVVERERVTSAEVDYRVPVVPALPRRPEYSLKTSDIAWTEKYGTITREFVRYREEYGTSIRAWLVAVGEEFTRHEELFHLLPAVPAEHARYLGHLEYQSARASWIFPDQDAFLAHVTGADGVARLTGVYAVQGDLTKFPARYTGHGFIAVERNVQLGAVAAEAGAGAVFFAGGDITVNATVEAGLLAPGGRVKTPAAGPTVGNAVVRTIMRADQFTVERNEEAGASGAKGLSIDVAPVALAEALLRE